MTKPERVDELCTCGCLKSQHGGLNGHGLCYLCNCKFFTWKAMVYKQVLCLRSGDEVLDELKRTLIMKALEPEVSLLRACILRLHEFDVTVEVMFTYAA